MRHSVLSPLITLPTLPTFAWNSFGHEVVAAVAWQKLTPEQRQAYTAILKAHPYYHDDLERGVPADSPNHDQYVFMMAATWPDIVRMRKGETHDSHPTWHYYDAPVMADGKQMPPPSTQQTTAEPANAIEALKFERNILNEKDADPADRAKALCWVLHLVGDLHQPLHCVSLYDADFPDGDRGGNEIKLAGSKGSATRRPNLHGLWDGILGQKGDVVFAAVAAEQFAKDAAIATAVAERARDLDAMHWVAEGRELAVKVAYRQLELSDAGELLQNVDRVNVDPDRAYLRRARDVAREQVVLAGLRLASVLR